MEPALVVLVVTIGLLMLDALDSVLLVVTQV
jgi:hypothetical protein